MDPIHGSIIAEEDRISNLPDDIIYRVLSFLDMKYVIQTSALSKKWKHIWTSMPHLNLNSRRFPTLPQFGKFVKHTLSYRNRHTAVSAVELSIRGAATIFLVQSIIKYAYSHNVRKLTLKWLTWRNLEFPQCLFSSHTLKHLTLEANENPHYRLAHCVPKSAWDFPALETLNLRYIELSDDGDKSLNLFSKCVNLKDLTLHRCAMFDLDIFNVCAPKLSNITITDPDIFPKVFNVVAPQLENFTITNPDCFPKVFNVVAPQLENLTASVSTTNRKTLYGSKGFYFLQLSTEGLDSLEKVNLSLPRPLCENERYGPRLLDLFKKLRTAKFLIVDMGIIEALSSCLDQLSHEPCPFNNLKCLKQKDGIETMPTQVRNYLLESSPSATFIMDLPRVPRKRSRQEEENQQRDTMAEEKRSRQEVDKDTMAKKMEKLEEEKQQLETMVEEKRSRHEADKGTMAKKALSCMEQLSHEPSPFNNLKCLKQKNSIPRIPSQVRNYFLESSPNATFTMDLPQVPHNRSRQKVDEGTMAKKMTKLVEEKQLPEIMTMVKEKRSRQEADKGTMAKKALSVRQHQLSLEPYPFNNLNCLKINTVPLKCKDHIATMPTQARNYLFESSPSNVDLPQQGIIRKYREDIAIAAHPRVGSELWADTVGGKKKGRLYHIHEPHSVMTSSPRVSSSTNKPGASANEVQQLKEQIKQIRVKMEIRERQLQADLETREQAMKRQMATREQVLKAEMDANIEARMKAFETMMFANIFK